MNKNLEVQEACRYEGMACHYENMHNNRNAMNNKIADNSVTY